MTTWNKTLCKRLGVTEAGLRVLAKAVAGQPISGAGAGYLAQGARRKLIREGYLISLPWPPECTRAEWGEPLQITDKGLGIVRRARAAGW